MKEESYCQDIGLYVGHDGDRHVKTRCLVQSGLGAHDGLEMVEKTEWQKSFKRRSKVAAKIVLASSAAPVESVEWARRVLNGHK
jgi:GTP cyclohydrolase III